jgi:hypothetical protein|tara:strand:- start:2298 stop:2462 length:165 start_codon:yes stop_codon:yes gene_type:complete
MSKWIVINTESSAMRSLKEVIDTFDTLVEAVALSETDARFRVITKMPKDQIIEN